MNQRFVEERRQELERMQEELTRDVEVERQEFSELFKELSTKDYEEIAEVEIEHEAVGLLDLQERERLRRVASALHRIEIGTYGYCASCGGEIHPDRLKAEPDALLCIDCKRRREQERS
jgi:DnaK suppressor protein